MSSLLPEDSEFLLYQSDDGKIRIETRLVDESVWLTINQMAELFGIDKSGISRHLKNVFDSGELPREAVVAVFATTASDGKTYQVEHFNLDAIISVGYRVNSIRGTQFRIWATKRLREYLIKGFVLDDERLKNPPVGSSRAPDFFDEMLERVRDIRASERRMYLRVRDILSMAADYAPGVAETNRFFSIIQNKLHYATTGLTAAELIQQRANYALPNMGLTSWKGGAVQLADVTTAKNYLSKEEIDGLNRIVVMWLDFAEDQAKRRKQVFLRDWEQKLDEFLRFNDRAVLPDLGKVTKREADAHAKGEYEKFAQRRREHMEALAEADYLYQLEQAAEHLPDPADDEAKARRKKV